MMMQLFIRFSVCDMCERQSYDADLALRSPCGVPQVLREDHTDGC